MKFLPKLFASGVIILLSGVIASSSSSSSSVSSDPNTININAAKSLLLLLTSSSPSSPFSSREKTTTTTTTRADDDDDDSVVSHHLRIIQINDVYELDNFAHLKTLIDYYKKNDHDTDTTTNTKTLVICCGDFVSPSLLSSLDKGYSMVDILNEIGVDYVCLGNHEADIPNDALRARIKQSRFEWINSNMPNLNDKLLLDLPQHKIITIKNSNNNNSCIKKVGLLGLCTDDKSLYRKGAFGGAKINPIPASVRYWKDSLLSSSSISEEVEEERDDDDSCCCCCCCCDIVICMTHQGIDLDRNMAKELGDINQLPLIVGGHDHEPYNEVVHGCHIIKTGMDAHRAAVIDICWKQSNDNNNSSISPPTVKVEMVDTNTFKADPKILHRVESFQDILIQLDEAKLFAIKDRVNHYNDNRVFSTKDNRLKTSTGTVAFASVLRMGLRCELCLLNAGSVRGGKDYPIDDDFTLSDLKAEMPFPNHMAVCKVPGKVIQSTIKHSRQYAKRGIAKGGYIHLSRCCVINESDDIETISGEPFDPNREYLTAFPYCFLTGIDNHIPLLEWAKTKDGQQSLPNFDSAIPAKFVFVECLSALLWLRLGNFDELAGDDGIITKDDVRNRMKELYGADGGDAVSELMLDNVFAVADRDQSGTISMLEQMVVRYAARDMLNHVVSSDELAIMTDVVKNVLGGRNGQDNDNNHPPPSLEEVEAMVREIQQVLDVDGSGTFDRDELLQALGEVTGKDYLS